MRKNNYLCFLVFSTDFATITFAISIEPGTTIERLNKTLESLIENSSPEERDGIIIVIYLGERVERHKQIVIKEWIYQEYTNHLDSGFFQVVQSPQSVANTRPQRSANTNSISGLSARETRRDLAVDTAFMLAYCNHAHKTRFFMQLSDDATFEKEFIAAIRDFVRRNCPNRWHTLHFATIGVTGRLYHRSELHRLANFLMFFSPRYGIDVLYQYYADLRSQRVNYLRVPSIFRKIENRTLPRNPRNARKTPKNPRGAMVYSSITPFSEKHYPEAALSRSTMYFLGMNPQPGDEVVVILPAPMPIKHLRVDSGHRNEGEGDPEGTLRDILLDGRVEISSYAEKLPTDGNKLQLCKKYHTIGYSVLGTIDIGDIDRQYRMNVTCIRITVLQKQLQWLAIERIFIWT